MLIYNLGSTRTKLLASFKDLTDEQINQKPSANKWSIAQVVYHLYTTEKETSTLILDNLHTKSEKVAERDLSFIEDRTNKAKAKIEPPTDFFTKKELSELLEESRFQHLQFIFNETHKQTLLEMSMEHPYFGLLSLKNVVDTIWLHEKRHIEQINEIKQTLN